MKKALYIGRSQAGVWIKTVLENSSLGLEACADYEAARQRLKGLEEELPALILLGTSVDADLFAFLKEVSQPCVVVLASMQYDVVSQLRQQGAAGFVVERSDSEQAFFRIQSALHTAEGVRKNARVIAKLEIEYRAQGNNFKDKTYSLSRQGVFIATSKPLPINTELFVRFNLPDQQQFIACSGKVSYVVNQVEGKVASYPNGMAVVFTGINEADQKRIDAYTATLEGA